MQYNYNNTFLYTFVFFLQDMNLLGSDSIVFQILSIINYILQQAASVVYSYH